MYEGITITKISNGYLVNVPYEVPVFDTEMFRDQARTYKEELHGDDLLKSLQDVQQKPKKRKLKQADNIIFFSKMTEVFQYISTIYNED